MTNSTLTNASTDRKGCELLTSAPAALAGYSWVEYGTSDPTNSVKAVKAKGP